MGNKYPLNERRSRILTEMRNDPNITTAQLRVIINELLFEFSHFRIRKVISKSIERQPLGNQRYIDIIGPVSSCSTETAIFSAGWMIKSFRAFTYSL